MPPPLQSSPLCCHTLADWETLMNFITRHCHRIRPDSINVLLEALRCPLESTDPHHKATARNWPSLLRWEKGRLAPTPQVLAELPAADVAASLRRVLRAMLAQNMTTLSMGILLHACRPEPLYFGRMQDLPWTKDCKHRSETVARLCEAGLISLVPEIRPGLRCSGRVRLTPAGEALLLGHWGKALADKPARAAEVNVGRMAA